VEVCRLDRQGFEKLPGQSCASAALCLDDGAAVRCGDPVCEVGHHQCRGAQLERCSDDRDEYLPVQTCGSDSLCNAGRQRCEPPVCLPGQQRCVGSRLERCNASLTAMRQVSDCGSAALCDPALAACLDRPTPPPDDPPVDPPVDPPPVDPPPVDPPVVVPPPPPPLGSGPYDFVETEGPGLLGLGPLLLTRPTAWSSVAVGAWLDAAGATLGPLYVASSDAARFRQFFDIPGVFFAATARLPGGVPGALAFLDLSATCTSRAPDVPYPFDSLYEGTTARWEGCGATGATTYVVAAAPRSDAFVVVVVVTVLAARDEVARQRVWDSFRLDE
jgi:hypothetical protein